MSPARIAGRRESTTPWDTDAFLPAYGDRTTSAPFYSWVNWEVYRIAREGVEAKAFLEEAYRSGAAFAEFLLKNRDRDGDGGHSDRNERRWFRVFGFGKKDAGDQ